MTVADPKPALDNLHRQIQKQGIDFRSELERDPTACSVRLVIRRVSVGSVLSVQVKEDRNEDPAYVDGYGNRIASVDDAAIAFWEIQTLI